ncbi:hypothetical protein H4R99_004457, partial [Coemansia sp. RSA 1722]
MVVWSHSRFRNKNANNTRINWLPTGIRPHIALWILYVVLLASVATATATLLYELQTAEKTLVTVLGFVFPLISSIVTLPKMIEKIRQGTAIRRKRGKSEGKDDNSGGDDEDGDNENSDFDKTPIINIDNHNASSASLVASPNT